MNTTHHHDPAGRDPRATVEAPLEPMPTASPRPRWMVPALAAGLIGLGLVTAGVISMSSLIYFGLVGGMLLMHLGGHGHGVHGGGAGHGTSLSQRSDDTQPAAPGSHAEGSVDEPVTHNAHETNDHDRHPSSSCH